MSLIIADSFQPNSGQIFTLDGNVNITGDLSATTIYGNSGALTIPIYQIFPSGSAVTSVNTYLQYGINVISSASTSDFCVRLPQTPIEGKEVFLINKSGFNIYVFPSMSGGSIDGVVNGKITIPSDNQSYSFICYENPAPGSWSVNFVASPPGQYDSGVINIDTTQGNGSSYVSAYDNNFKNNAVGFYFSSVAYESLTQSNILYQPNPFNFSYSGFAAVVYFKPVIPWQFINKISVYTNFTTIGGTFGLVEGYEQCYYSAGTISPVGVNQNMGGGNAGLPAYGGCDELLAGTPLIVSNGFTAQPGEPGTYWGELIYSASTRPFGVGDILLSSGTFNLGIPVNGIVNADLWSSKYIGFIFETNQISPDVKFRFIIDYTI